MPHLIVEQRWCCSLLFDMRIFNSSKFGKDKWVLISLETFSKLMTEVTVKKYYLEKSHKSRYNVSLNVWSSFFPQSHHLIYKISIVM